MLIAPLKQTLLVCLVALCTFGCTLFKDASEVECTDCGCDVKYYPDVDGDSFGDANASPSCQAQDGWVTDNTDCDDESDLVFVGAGEICDQIDNNCNVDVDEACQTAPTDDDGDGYCAEAADYSAMFPQICTAGGADCAPSDADISPGATEACNLVDLNCDGEVGVPQMGPVHFGQGFNPNEILTQTARLGSVVVQIWLERDVVDEARMRVFSLPSLSGLAEPVELGPRGYEVHAVDVIALPESNRFLVAYVRADTAESPWSLYYQFAAGDGTLLGEPTHVGSTEFGSPFAMAADGDGGAMFVYTKRVESSVVRVSRPLDLVNDQLGLVRVLADTALWSLNLEWDEPSQTYFLASQIQTPPYGIDFGRIAPAGYAAQTVGTVNQGAVRFGEISLVRVDGRVNLIWSASGTGTWLSQLDEGGVLSGDRHRLSSAYSTLRYRAFGYDPTRQQYAFTVTNSGMDAEWTLFDEDFVATRTGPALDLRTGLTKTAEVYGLQDGFVVFGHAKSEPKLQALHFGGIEGPELSDTFVSQVTQPTDSYLWYSWVGEDGINGLWGRGVDFDNYWDRLLPDGTWEEVRPIPPTPTGCGTIVEKDNTLYCASYETRVNCENGMVGEVDLQVLKLSETWEVQASHRVSALGNGSSCRPPSIEALEFVGDTAFMALSRRDPSGTYPQSSVVGFDMNSADDASWEYVFFRQEVSNLPMQRVRIVGTTDKLALVFQPRGDPDYETTYLELDSAGTASNEKVLIPHVPQAVHGLTGLTFDGQNVLATWYRSQPGLSQYTTILAKLEDGDILQERELPFLSQYSQIRATPEYSMMYTNRDPFIGLTLFDNQLNVISDEVLDFGTSMPNAQGGVWFDEDSVQVLMLDYSFQAYYFLGQCN